MLLMDFTNIGRTRVSQIALGLEFEIDIVAYGTGGYGPPNTAVSLNPLAVSLTSEVYRRSVLSVQVSDLFPNREKVLAYTSVSGMEVTGNFGEAGLFATVKSSGSTAVPVGEVFLLAHAHFPRIHLDKYSKLAIKWPLDLDRRKVIVTLTGEGNLSVTAGVVALAPASTVSYYSLDNADLNGLQVLDGMGLNDATNVNAVTGVPGRVNEAFTFDGFSSRLVIPNDKSLASHAGLGTMTFAANVKTADLLADYTVASEYDTTNNEHAWKFEILNTTGLLRVTMSSLSAADSISVDSSIPVVAGTWSHIAFVYDQTQSGVTNQIKIYVDGLLDAGRTAGPAVGAFSVTSVSRADVLIGASNPPAPTGHFRGEMDEIAFFSGALSDNNISYLNTQSVNGTRLVKPLPVPDSTWTFNNSDYAAPNVLDVVGTNDGVNSGATTGQLGLLAEAFSFDGVANRIDFGNVLNPGAGDFSLVATFKWKGAGSSPRRVIGKGLVTGEASGFSLAMDAADTIDFTVSDGVATAVNAGPAVPADAWVTAVAVIDQALNEARLYVDGVLGSTQPLGLGAVNPATNLQIAAFSEEPLAPTFGDFLQGDIDEVSVFIGTAMDNDRARSLSNQPVPQFSDLVLQMSFDNADIVLLGTVLRDLTFRGNDGVLNGTVTTGASGKVGESFTFDGVSGYLNLQNLPDLDFLTTDPFSISLWMKTSTVSESALISKYNFNNTPGWQLFLRPTGEVALSLADLTFANARFSQTVSTWNDGQWHHIVCVYDGSNTAAGIQVYVDGVAQTMAIQTDTDPGAISNATRTYIGARDDAGFPNYYAGDMDDLYVFRAEISARHVQWLYSQGLKGRRL